MPIPKTSHCTYADYLSWDTEDKYELFDGVPVLQARPSVAHQRVETALASAFHQFLSGKPCEVLTEIEVLLPEHGQNAHETTTVYVPDIIIVCDPEKLKAQHCLGAPTLVVEILSPSTAKADKITKLQKYQQAQIPEYWIVDPLYHYIDVFVWKDGVYSQYMTYVQDGEVTAHAVPGLKINLADIFTS